MLLPGFFIYISLYPLMPSPSKCGKTIQKCLSTFWLQFFFPRAWIRNGKSSCIGCLLLSTPMQWGRRRDWQGLIYQVHSHKLLQLCIKYYMLPLLLVFNIHGKLSKPHLNLTDKANILFYIHI